MPHTLDIKQLEKIFDELEENAHKLSSWEMDRLPEWRALWERGRELSEKQLECLEKMYLKV
jgi:hypothetical protein